MEYLIELVVVFIAVVLADLSLRFWDFWRNKRLDIGCDYCEKACKTFKVKGTKFWLCRQCVEAYRRENE